MKILVICAVKEELGAFALPPDASLLVCGVGPVEAAIHTSRHLSQVHYDMIINMGVAGGFECRDRNIEVGSSVVVTHEHFVDLGREDGSALTLPGSVGLVTTVELPYHRLAQYPALQDLTTHSGSLWGASICSATITTSDTRAERLLARVPDALVESMEGFSIARAAQLFDTPCIELRGVSNRVGDRAKSGWDLRAGIGAAHALLEQTLTILKASS
jgi:futalosine hydrolase